MNNVELIESNYSLSNSNYSVFQFKLPLDFYTTVPVASFVKIMKGLDTSKYFNNVPHRGNQGYNPHMMLNVVLFAYMNKVPSLRELEEPCRYDIRYMWMADNETPSFMAFQIFISNTLSSSIKSVFYDICRRLIELDDIDTSVLYIDGTKIEANARKNSFVWKKAVLSNRAKLFNKVKKAIESIKQSVNSSFKEKSTYKSYELGVICDYLMRLIVDNNVDIVYEKGNRICPEGYVFSIPRYEKWSNEGEYLQISTSYTCGKCEGCPVREKCTKSKSDREITVNSILDEMYEIVDRNLSTVAGIEMKRQEEEENVLTEILLVFI